MFVFECSTGKTRNWCGFRSYHWKCAIAIGTKTLEKCSAADQKRFKEKKASDFKTKTEQKYHKYINKA